MVVEAIRATKSHGEKHEEETKCTAVDQQLDNGSHPHGLVPAVCRVGVAQMIPQTFPPGR